MRLLLRGGGRMMALMGRCGGEVGGELAISRDSSGKFTTVVGVTWIVLGPGMFATRSTHLVFGIGKFATNMRLRSLSGVFLVDGPHLADG